MVGMTTQQNPKHLGAAFAAALCVPALALAACGGDDADRGRGAKSDQARFEEAALEHAECMRRNGVDVPDPKPGSGAVLVRPDGGGGSPAAEREAQKKCDKYLRDVPPPKLSESQKAEMRDGALAHARCMRKQGVDFPDPTFDRNGGASVKIGPGMDPSNPRVREAEERCSKYLPGPKPDDAGAGQ